MAAQNRNDARRESDATSVFDENAVPSYYSRKTADIVHKYGPGPRIHFHLGLFPDQGLDMAVSSNVLRRRIVDSQEALLACAAKAWNIAQHPPGDLLEVGCGLGGGALYWAQEHGATVTAVTITPEHVPLVTDFAHQAGVADRVTAVLADIHDFTQESAFDAAVAVESSGYMDRARLFPVIARALKPGGWFGIAEHFVCQPEWFEILDVYYKTRLGTVAEYVTAAGAAGFTLEHNEDLTDRVTGFWSHSKAWSARELEASASSSPISQPRLVESMGMHERFIRAWRDHEVETRLLQFRL
jgi:tocopherol O-methyltransferase